MPEEKTPPFAEAIERLEEIVQRLEEEEVPLEEAATLFEEGIKLAKVCSTKLTAVEKRIELLMKDADETFRTVPFDEPDND